MPAPRTGTPLALVTMAALGIAGAGLAGCNNKQVTDPPNKVNASDLAAGGDEMTTGGMAGGTAQGTQDGKGPRELATANTEHAPNQETESQ
ncbi:MAG TPA: hypothetical protein VF559_04730 [Caulobacteraceae bacterium]|jgi:hypothetical protein